VNGLVLAASDDSVAGPLGLLVVLLMAIATVLLIRNMNRRLKRLPPSFPSDDAPGGEEHHDGR
jgi:hypothetical protein